MEPGLLTIVEVLLRVVLGLRFLSSGLSNVRRWPHAVGTTRIAFPQGATFFGFAAVALLVLGGAGVALGFQTRIAAMMLVIFLIPTFKIQWHWLKMLPAKVEKVKGGLTQKESSDDFQLLGKHAIHSHEVALQDNLVLLLVALFFLVRGSVAFGLDNFLS